MEPNTPVPKVEKQAYVASGPPPAPPAVAVVVPPRRSSLVNSASVNRSNSTVASSSTTPRQARPLLKKDGIKWKLIGQIVMYTLVVLGIALGIAGGVGALGRGQATGNKSTGGNELGTSGLGEAASPEPSAIAVTDGDGTTVILPVVTPDLPTPSPIVVVDGPEAQRPSAPPMVYLTGSQAEGTAAYTVTGADGISYGTDRYRRAAAALDFKSGSHLAARPPLPPDGTPRSLTLWMRTDPDITYSANGLPAVPDGLWAYYDMSLASAASAVQLADVSANGRTGSVLSDGTLAQGGLRVAPGQGMLTPIMILSNFSMSFVFTLEAPATVDYTADVSVDGVTLLGYANVNSQHLVLLRNALQPSQLVLGITANGVHIPSTYVLVPNRPTVLTLVMFTEPVADGPAVQHSRVYADGLLVLDSDVSFDNALAPFDMLTMGGLVAGSAIRGLFDDVCLYGRALAQAEVTAMAVWHAARQATAVTLHAPAVSRVTGGALDSRFGIGMSGGSARATVGAVELVSSPDTTGDGRWHHVALTYDNTYTARLYVDGTLRATGAGGVLRGSTVLSLAWSGDGSSPQEYSGALQDIRVYGRALTAAEVVNMTLPALPSYSGASNPIPAAGQTRYTWSCLAGFAGPSLTWQQSAVDLAWTAAGGPMSCPPCAPGYYSYAGSPGCAACPAGTIPKPARDGCVPN